MKRLYANESIDDSLTVVASELSPEAALISDVQLETAERAADIIETANGINDANDALGHLETVQTFVEDHQGEELSAPALEAIRIAVTSIADRVGARPAVLKYFPAMEAHGSQSARRATAEMALEGIGDFLRDFWKRIKAMIRSLIDKAKDFWDKYVSGLGKMKRAVEAAKQRVSEITGKPKEARVEHAPGHLARLFAPDSEISPLSIRRLIGADTVADAALNSMAVQLKGTADKIAVQLQSAIANNAANLDEVNESELVTVTISTRESPLIGGRIIAIRHTGTFIKEGEEFVFEWEEESTDARADKVSLQVGDKGELKELLDSARAIITNEIESRKEADKTQKTFRESLGTLDKHIGDLEKKDSVTDEDRAIVELARRAARSLNTLVGNVTSTELRLRGYRVELVKAIIQYTDYCAAQYR